MHERHGELLPNGYHVGDLVSYEGGDGPNYGHVVPSRYPSDSRPSEMVWALWSHSGEGALERARDRYRREPGSRPTWTGTGSTTLVERYDGTEGENMMTEQQGSWVPATESGVPNGARFRVYHDSRGQSPANPDEFAYEGVMRDWSRRDVTYTGNGTYTYSRNDLPVDIDGWDALMGHEHYAYFVPAEMPMDEAYDGQKGAFVGHDGQVPESGTIVRGMNTDTRQIEGLFLRMDGEAEATIEAKRRRRRLTDGTFSEWEGYENTARRNIRVAGAEVFKPGATPETPAEVHYGRTTPIGSEADNAELAIGDVVSARGYDDARYVYRGAISRQPDRNGRIYINATHRCRLADPYSTSGVYNWSPIDQTEIRIYMDWSEGRELWDRAGWKWEKLAPGQKPVDPQFDPNRKTPHTGMKIGDLVVGLRTNGGRDTVSSWIRGEIVKWDTRNGHPIVRVTDPMESGGKVGQEFPVSKADVYPALADPKNADPEEFKKTLRLYLIGRHKHGDFCRGGLNTMLAAFGIPLYETRRVATMVVTVDYDPNNTDLYQVQRQLQSSIRGVNGLSLDEREGREVEVESDVTAG